MRDGRASALAARLEPRWGPQRAAAIRAALVRRTGRRRVARIGSAVAGVLAACALVAVLATRPWRGVAIPAVVTAIPAVAAPSGAPASATPLVDGTDLAPGPEGDGRSFVLRTGMARFVVTHDASHPFRVRAADLIIEDVGTVFTVGVAPGGLVSVEVQDGSVRVRRGALTVDVQAGDRRDFGPEAAAAPPEPAPRPSAATTAGMRRWRELAESGRYDDAYQALRAAGAAAVHDDTGELLVAADAARLGGHPADAVPYLQRVVIAHGRDPRAPLAAFTLGRVLLDDLGRPAEAAEAFERGRAAAGALGEDALAREVEALSRAGESARARALATEYVRLYPAGRRRRTVEKFGGLP